MADDKLTDVISDLDSLRTGTIRAGIEFKGFTKTITSVAAGTEGASKSWTTFSRLVSGTPIWAFQNKLRAYLSILGGIEKRSQANAKAMDDEQKRMLDKIKGYDKLSKVTQGLARHEKNLIKLGFDDKKLMDSAKKNSGDASKAGKKRTEDLGKYTEYLVENTKEIQEALVYSAQYQQVLLGGGSEEKAMMRALKFYKDRNKEVAKEQLSLKKSAKLAYAYDRSRIDEAVKLATIKKKEVIQGKNRGRFSPLKIKDRFSMAGARVGADLKERKSMRKDQKMSTRAAQKDALRAGGTGFKDNLKNAKMLLAPLLIVTKSAKAIYMAVNPMSSGARKFRTKMYGLIQKLQPLFSVLFKYLIMGMLAIAGFFVILMFMKRYYEILVQFGVVDEIKELGHMAFAFLKVGWKAISAFISGDYQKALDHLSVFIDKGIELAIKTAKVLAKLAFYALVAGFDLLLDGIYKFYKDPAFRKQIMGILMKVGLIIAGLIIVQFLIGLALTVAAAFALPILLGVVILAALFTVAYWLNKKFDDQFQHIEDAIATVFNMVYTVINDTLNALVYIKDGVVDKVQKAYQVLKDFYSFGEKKEKARAWMKSIADKVYEKVLGIYDFLTAKKIREKVQAVRDKYNAIKKDGTGGKGYIRAIQERDSLRRDSGIIKRTLDYANDNFRKPADDRFIEHVMTRRQKEEEMQTKLLTKQVEATMYMASRPDATKEYITKSMKFNFEKQTPKPIQPISAFAKGGISKGGMALVGELGPELVRLNRGDRVYSNSQSKQMTGNTNINITINAKDTSKAEMRRIATELGTMINTKMNRTGATRTMR